MLEFFAACGVTVLEGYGMTETSAASTLNTRAELRVGSVGRPLPGIEVAIAEDGEILMRGPHVFAGYHRDPQRPKTRWRAAGCTPAISGTSTPTASCTSRAARRT